MTVADASVVADALRAMPCPARDALDGADLPLAAPQLIDLEVASTYRRQILAGNLSDHDALELLRRLAQLPLERHAHEPLMPRIWELRHHVTPYDAAYVALAERLGATLLTRDARLGRTQGLRCDVRIVP